MCIHPILSSFARWPRLPRLLLVLMKSLIPPTARQWLVPKPQGSGLNGSSACMWLHAIRSRRTRKAFKCFSGSSFCTSSSHRPLCCRMVRLGSTNPKIQSILGQVGVRTFGLDSGFTIAGTRLQTHSRGHPVEPVARQRAAASSIPEAFLPGKCVAGSVDTKAVGYRVAPRVAPRLRHNDGVEKPSAVKFELVGCSGFVLGHLLIGLQNTLAQSV